VLAYNGVVPGPTIRGNVGDLLIVHFRNDLDEETTVHWHGLQLPADMDGSPTAQVAVPPGGTLTYEFRLLDAATYWFHSHIHTNQQVEAGLYGALVVRDKHEDKHLGLPNREHMLVLDDVLLDGDGQIAEPLPDDPLERAVMLANGREGNALLVNGEITPRGSIKRGVPHRLRLINVANSRFMRISIPGHRMFRIGGDGGLLETPVEIQPINLVPSPHNPHHMMSDPDLTKGLLLTPGERADVVFTPIGDGPIKLEWHDMARGRHTAFYKPDGSGDIGLGHDHHDGMSHPHTLMTLDLVGNAGGAEYIPPGYLRPVAPIDVADSQKIVLEFGHTPPDRNGDITFFAQRKNGMSLPFAAVTPEDAPTVTVGETRIIEIRNLTGGDHNFHAHGFFFQPIEIEYRDMDDPDIDGTIEPFPMTEVKDTVRVPARPGAAMRSRTIVRLAVMYDDTGREGEVAAHGKEPHDDMSGGWVMHCHILEHADHGMMTFLQVRYPEGG
jgi:FtsP/CotA-like multicopper oxidase with cupredoxin domain